MSRIGRMPIAIPAGVTVEVAENNKVTVKGPKGTLVSERELLDLEAEGNAKLIVTKQALERVRAILTTGKPLRN